MNKEKEIYVYADFLYHNCEPVGTIYVSESRGRETYAFEYESSWLKRSDQFLDPDLQLYAEQEIAEIRTIVEKNWEILAKGFGISRNEIERMSPAFRG
ncbi:MAG: hypothetical protein E7307_08730 [Butyrivibrio sp.]|nr:hypothetical protein [Butyrivibrio sp.]